MLSGTNQALTFAEQALVQGRGPEELRLYRPLIPQAPLKASPTFRRRELRRACKACLADFVRLV